MILITGDSNYREVYTKFKKKIEKETKETVIYKQYTTNESLKLVLAGEDGKERPKVTLIGAGLNEVAARSKKKGKSQDEIIRTVSNDQNTVVLKQAERDSSSLFGMMPPFLRQDPAWIGEKYSLMFFYMKNYSNKFNPGNLYVGSPVAIVESDLKDDKVHLNDSGLEKLVVQLIDDAKVALKDVAILRNPDRSDDVELVSSQLSDWSKTPESTRKRTRDEDESEESDAGNASKKNRPTEAVEAGSNSELISTLQQFMQQMREDRKADSDLVKKVELTQNSLVEKQKETDEKVEKLTDIVSTDSDIFASIKEDVDASENDSLRTNVIVKKLATKDKIPSDKKELSKFVQDKGRSLVKDVLGEEAEKEVKFVSTLYISEKRAAPAPEDPVFVPPFKLVFKTKEAGMKFREAAVKLSKEGKEGFEKTYFTH